MLGLSLILRSQIIYVIMHSDLIYSLVNVFKACFNFTCSDMPDAVLFASLKNTILKCMD